MMLSSKITKTTSEISSKPGTKSFNQQLDCQKVTDLASPPCLAVLSFHFPEMLSSTSNDTHTHIEMCRMTYVIAIAQIAGSFKRWQNGTLVIWAGILFLFLCNFAIATAIARSSYL